MIFLSLAFLTQHHHPVTLHIHTYLSSVLRECVFFFFFVLLRAPKLIINNKPPVRETHHLRPQTLYILKSTVAERIYISSAHDGYFVDFLWGPSDFSNNYFRLYKKIKEPALGFSSHLYTTRQQPRRHHIFWVLYDATVDAGWLAAYTEYGDFMYIQ